MCVEGGGGGGVRKVVMWTGGLRMRCERKGLWDPIQRSPHPCPYYITTPKFYVPTQLIIKILFYGISGFGWFRPIPSIFLWPPQINCTLTGEQSDSVRRLPLHRRRTLATVRPTHPKSRVTPPLHSHLVVRVPGVTSPYLQIKY